MAATEAAAVPDVVIEIVYTEDAPLKQALSRFLLQQADRIRWMARERSHLAASAHFDDLAREHTAVLTYHGTGAGAINGVPRVRPSPRVD